MNKTLVFLMFFFLTIATFSQEIGRVKGKVINAQTRKPIELVNVIVSGTQKGAVTNELGEFEIANINLGYIKLMVSSVGFATSFSEDYLVTKDKTPYILIELKEDASELDEVVIPSSLFKRKAESPVSLQNLGIAEIEKNPGGDRDILKVIQSLPGVASNPGFRNDIIIRGGATNENKFYLDGIEIPVINHFQTQGASGGPVGIINADLIRKVDFYSSAFTANRGNALSSIIEFTQKTGNLTSFEGRATLGTSDAGITLQAPLSKNTSVIASARQSYLQYLFKVIKLPFLPTYNDFQLNIKSKLSDNDELSIIGLGAIDNFKLNKEVNNNVKDAKTLKRNNYILGNVPIQNQWNYTLGASYKHYANKSTQTYVVSRNEWENKIIKYTNNTNKKEDLLLNYASKEIENKFRFENDMQLQNELKFNFGLAIQQSTYKNKTFQKFANLEGEQLLDFNSKLNLFSYALFAQATKKAISNKLQLSLGLRLDGVNYNAVMKNPLNQFSPRFSASYKLAKKWFLNASAGKYFQLPSYTILGFRNSQNMLVNASALTYISSTHTVAGLEFRPENNSKITIESFYKKYNNYPFSIKNKISLANLGSDFGTIGNEAVTSNNKGRAYGVELLAQKKSYNGIYGILAYTFVVSEFKGIKGNYIPSTWDNRHLLTLTGGKKLKNNWEIGSKFRLVGGRPYTPYNYEKSALITNYTLNQKGILDYTKLNSKRFKTYTQLDIRVDKTWFWKTFSVNLYIDVQNIYASASKQTPFLFPATDVNGNKVVDFVDNRKYKLEEIESTSGRILPSFGIIVDF